MECEGTCPQHVMINYMNGDYDGSDHDADYDDD